MPAALCVYALVPAAAERVSARGLAGARLRVVRSGAVAAIVAVGSRRGRPTEPALRAYDRIMQSLAQQFPALVPVRFGTYVEDAGEMELILRARQATLKRTLSQVRNRAQMTLRIAIGAPGEPGRALPSMATGAQYLRARAAAQTVPELEALRPAIQQWIRDERVERRDRVASVYHLVPRGSVKAYRDALAAAAERQQLRLAVSGPWPAYAFAAQW
jgi:hypothetical protein